MDRISFVSYICPVNSQKIKEQKYIGKMKDTEDMLTYLYFENNKIERTTAVLQPIPI